MLAAGRDELICDLAETYGILDWRALPATTLATLAAGLREGARIRMKLSGTKAPQNTLLLAACLDKLSFLAWAQTADGQAGRNRPVSVLELLLGKKERTGDVQAFDTGEEFEAARQKILQGE